MTARDLISCARQLGGSRRADASDLSRAQVLLLELAAALEAAQREPIAYVIGTDIPGKIELYEDQVLTKEESVEWLTNLKANKPDIWRAFGLIEVEDR